MSNTPSITTNPIDGTPITARFITKAIAERMNLNKAKEAAE